MVAMPASGQLHSLPTMCVLSLLALTTCGGKAAPGLICLEVPKNLDHLSCRVPSPSISSFLRLPFSLSSCREAMGFQERA